MANRARILSITSELPWPLNSGGHLRTYHVQQALGQECNAELVCPVAEQQQAEPALPADASFALTRFNVPPRSLFGELPRVAAAQFYRAPYTMYFRHRRRRLQQYWNLRIKNDSPDVLWLDHIDSFLFAPQRKPLGTQVVIDLHNVYSLILRRLAEESTHRLRRWALMIEAQRMQRIERQICGRIDAVIAVSDEEAAYYRQLGARRVHVAPNGVDCHKVTWNARENSSSNPIILFVGAMNWKPNVSAAIALATEIFPRVRQAFPGAQLNLVGKSPLPEVVQLALQPAVTVTGTVPSIEPYLREAAVFAVPLDSGGGTRLKILEAFAAGVPVVSTAVGAEGISAQDGVHLRLSTRERMTDAIIQMLRDGSGPALAVRARKLVEQQYDWRVIGEQLVRFLKELQ